MSVQVLLVPFVPAAATEHQLLEVQSPGTQPGYRPLLTKHLSHLKWVLCDQSSAADGPKQASLISSDGPWSNLRDKQLKMLSQMHDNLLRTPRKLSWATEWKLVLLLPGWLGKPLLPQGCAPLCVSPMVHSSGRYALSSRVSDDGSARELSEVELLGVWEVRLPHPSSWQSTSAAPNVVFCYAFCFLFLVPGLWPSSGFRCCSAHPQIPELFPSVTGPHLSECVKFRAILHHCWLHASYVVFVTLT